MTLRSEYSLGHSQFNDFLFAVVGEEKSGQELTVLSAMARLGLDPWKEAARLSELPEEAAVKSLAAALGAVPGEDWTMLPDKQAIALRLVNCLPRHGSPRPKPPQEGSTAAVEQRQRSGTFNWVLLAGLGVVLLFVLLWLYSSKEPEPVKSNIGLYERHQADPMEMAALLQGPATTPDRGTPPS